MNRSAIPGQKPGYKLAELEGECMLYHGAEAKALYLNETASMIWKLCDGQRTVETIEGLLRGAYPEARELPADVDAAFRVLIEHGAVEVR